MCSRLLHICTINKHIMLLYYVTCVSIYKYILNILNICSNNCLPVYVELCVCLYTWT